MAARADLTRPPQGEPRIAHQRAIVDRRALADDVAATVAAQGPKARAAVLGLRNEGKVSPDVQRLIERDLDLEEARLR